MEVRSLLWGMKKFTVDGKQHLAFGMPSSQLDRVEDELRKSLS